MVPFCKRGTQRGTILVPLKKGHCLCCKKGNKWCPLVKGYFISAPKSPYLQKGTKTVPQRALFYGLSNSLTSLWLFGGNVDE